MATSLTRKYPNGKVPASALRAVQGKMKLAADTAAVFSAMRSEARSDGYPSFGLAFDAGGYRDLWLQGDLKKNPAKHNASRASVVSIASPGLSKHGWGDAMDLVGAPLPYLIKLAAKYGCYRPFGSADPNHFLDKHTWKAEPAVPHTEVVKNGVPGGGGTALWKRVQLLARRGGYTGPIDGDLAGKSWEGVQRALKKYGFYRGSVDGDPRELTLVALQQWAGSRSPSTVSDWRKVSKANWKIVARKLNTL